jgi:hypothetical protein
VTADVVASDDGDLRRPQMPVSFKIEIECARDDRWPAEVVYLPGVPAYGATEDAALAHVQVLALRGAADRLEHDEAGRSFLDISFRAA